MVRFRTESERATTGPEKSVPVPSCATCGGCVELRLYELNGDQGDIRRWWCVDCAYFNRRLGIRADLAPAWVERAALRQLPSKPVDVVRDRIAFAGRRVTDSRA
jgi:hypothetical protein